MLSLKIAVRFLKSSKGQTILIALGIAVGVSVQVFIGSLIQGLQKSLINTTIGSSSQITITKSDDSEYISDYDQIIAEIDNLDVDTTIVSYSLNASGFLVDGSDTEPILLRGFDYDLANQIYGFDDKLLDGTLPINDNTILIGKQLSESLELGVGDSLDLEIPLIGSTTVTVSGIYDFRVVSINELWVMGSLPTVQNALQIGDEVSAIEMQVNDVFTADTTALAISEELNDDTLMIENWKDANADLLSGLSGQSASSYMIQVFVTLSVVLGISSVLAITVLQKSKQLGILKAMGLNNKQASRIFLFEGLILGLIGGSMGILLGLGLTFSFTTFAVNPDGTPIVDLYISPSFIALSAVIAVLAATIASVIPARRSKKSVLSR